MRKWAALLIFIVACTSSAIMTVDDYTAIQVGMSARDLESKYGKPVKMTTSSNGVTTYEYIERFMMGSKLSEMRRYYIQVQNGKVVGKYYDTQDVPPYQDIYTDDPFPEQVQ